VKNPRTGEILGTSGKRIGETVKDITKHYLQHERHCSSTEYFYWPWECLEDDDREHTGWKCKPCQESNYQAAVYGMEGVDKHNNPIRRRRKRTARRESAAEGFVGWICVRPRMLEPVYAQEVSPEDAVDKAKKAAPSSRAWKAGARKAKKLNEAQQLESAVMEWRGPGGHVHRQNARPCMSTHNTLWLIPKGRLRRGRGKSSWERGTRRESAQGGAPGHGVRRTV
jgi:hypothetical protein